MKSLLKMILVLIVCFASISAQQKRLPRFEDYLVSENYRGRIAPVELTSYKAKSYRTMLRLNAKQGVNFARHYIVVSWGCGSDLRFCFQFLFSSPTSIT